MTAKHSNLQNKVIYTTHHIVDKMGDIYTSKILILKQSQKDKIKIKYFTSIFRKF